VKRERVTRKRVQIRVIAEDPETVLKLIKIISQLSILENVSITGVYPNRKEPGFRGYLTAEVVLSE
jgi:hypothetical protein